LTEPTPLAAAPPEPLVVLEAVPPPFAPETTAVPAMLAQLDVALQKYVSPPLPPPTMPPAPIWYDTGVPDVSDTLTAFEYAPPPPPTPPALIAGVAPAPPPPITSIELFALFQLFGTVHWEPAVRTTVCCAL
jgi:hypothetical protein